MTKKEAISKLKSEWKAAPTATKMKSVKTLYNEVKNLNILDSELVPIDVEKKVSNIS